MDSTIATSDQRWLVDVRTRPDRAVALRDYFLRLGVSARLVGPALVELGGSEDESTLREYTGNWARVNRVDAQLRRGEAAAEPAPRAVGGVPLPPPRLGEVLRRKGLLTEEQLDAGLKESRATGELLGVALLRLGVIFEDELARTLSEQLGIPYVGVGVVGVDVDAASMLPRDVGLRLAAIPVRVKDEAIQVAFADPTDSVAIDGVKVYISRMRLAVAELSAIREAWQHVPRRLSD